MHDTLNTLEAFVSSLNVDCIIIGDDYNVNFSRVNAHTVELVSFLNNINVTPYTNSITHPISFTRNHGDVFSCINHFSISGYLATDTTCVKYVLLDDHDISVVNLSDHCPVLLQGNFATGPGISEPVNRP